LELERFGRAGIWRLIYHKLLQKANEPSLEAPFEGEKRGEIPLLTISPILLSSIQNFSPIPLLGGRVWYGDFEPHFLHEEEWGFLSNGLLPGIVFAMFYEKNSFLPAMSGKGMNIYLISRIKAEDQYEMYEMQFRQ
jgi:hypothetical protein